jgi:hypothetical protein
MKVGELTKLHRKSGGMGHPPFFVRTEGRALQPYFFTTLRVMLEG